MTAATKTRTKPRSTARDAAQAAEAREAKLTAIHEQLAAAVENLTTGEAWADMLAAASRFHRYSTGGVGIFEVRECSRSRDT